MSQHSDDICRILMNMLIAAAIVNILLTLQVSAVSISEGKEFLLSTPALVTSKNLEGANSRLSFHFTSQESIVQITFRVYWTTAAQTNADSNLDFNFTKIHIFEVEPIFHYSNKPGLRWSFHAEGSHHFGLLVHSVNGDGGFETFVAVPVAGWGKTYYVVTLGYMYSVIIMTKEGPNSVYFTVRTEKKNQTMRIGNTTYEDGEIWSVELKSYQAFAVSHCEENKFVGALTGSTVRGTFPLGVVTGNCLTHTVIVACDDNATSNTVAEMLLPQETYGKTFILFNMTSLGGWGYHVIVAGSDATMVSVFREIVHSYYFTLKVKGGWWILREDEPCHVFSDKKVQVTYVHTSSCLTNRTSFPSLCLIIPMELYYFKYICSIPDAMDTTHCLVLAVQKRYSGNISSENLAFASGFHRQLASKSWLVMSATIVTSTPPFTVYSTLTRFGCYLFGQSPGASYMHPAGFISSPIHENCTKTINNMRALDLIDNDCDGSIDEEIRNQIDDDRDQLIDEDLNILSGDDSRILSAYPYPHKQETATSTPSILLTRDSQRSQDSSTTTDVTVATKECTLPFHWGEHCIHSCRNCLTDCNKLNGSCDSCYPGFEDPHLGCTTVKGKYLAWLPWHCVQDCNEHSMVRTRLCKDGPKCFKVITERRPGNCYRTMCPEDCQPYTWGVDCAQSCVNCGDDCNKFNGTCSYCKSGFKGSNSSCSQACGYNEYGVNCRGNCKSICGEDCMDRKEGLCHEYQIDIQLLVASISLMVILLAVTAYCFLCCKLRREEQMAQETLSNTIQEGSKSQLNRHSSHLVAPVGVYRSFSRSSLSPRPTPSSGRLAPGALRTGSTSNLRSGSNVDPQRVQYARGPPVDVRRYSSSRSLSFDALRRHPPAHLSPSKQSGLNAVKVSRSASSVRQVPALK